MKMLSLSYVHSWTLEEIMTWIKSAPGINDSVNRLTFDAIQTCGVDSGVNIHVVISLSVNISNCADMTGKVSPSTIMFTSWLGLYCQRAANLDTLHRVVNDASVDASIHAFSNAFIEDIDGVIYATIGLVTHVNTRRVTMDDHPDVDGRSKYDGMDRIGARTSQAWRDFSMTLRRAVA